jgi:hypothetical protein
MRASLVRIALAWMIGIVACGVASADLGYKGWGPRVGVADDPDQVVVGAHWDVGEFIPNLRFQPSVEVGFGDDVNALLGNFMIAWYFLPGEKARPYAGGQVVVAWFDPDNGDSDTELGTAPVGGIEMTLDSGNRFLAEIQFGIGDIHDFKVMAGWTF